LAKAIKLVATAGPWAENSASPQSYIAATASAPNSTLG
jgi:hypothetical protein